MNRRKSLGFNLVELMIALILSLLLGAIGIAVFMGSKQGFRIEQGLAETQDAGRAVLGYLRNEVAMAGYPGINTTVDALVSGLAAEKA